MKTRIRAIGRWQIRRETESRYEDHLFGSSRPSPFGGHSWQHLQYPVGLRRLGHEVTCFEDYVWPNSCYDPARDDMTASGYTSGEAGEPRTITPWNLTRSGPPVKTRMI
jgi:hypothetical protein